MMERPLILKKPAGIRVPILPQTSTSRVVNWRKIAISLFLSPLHCYNRQLTPSTKRILRVWLPAAIWLAVIAVESTNLGSAEHTGRILYPIFHFVFDMDPARFAVWHGLLRKTGHIVGYFTLSVLLFRSGAGPRLGDRRLAQRRKPQAGATARWSLQNSARRDGRLRSPHSAERPAANT